MVVGSTTCIGGLILQQVWANVVPTLMVWFPESQFIAMHQDKFPYDGARIALVASIAACSCYLIGSLMTWLILRYPAFNLERMLHRGKYAIKGEHREGVTAPPTGWRALLPGKEYTKGDKFIHFMPPVFIFTWFVFLIVMTVVHQVWGTSDGFWLGFWAFMVVLIVLIGVSTTLWLTIGGLIDMRSMLRALRVAKRDPLDDGRVVDHHSVADEQWEA